MKIAIIGLANSGKTTVFNALTRGTAETAAYSSGQLEPNIATVKVPDRRLDELVRMFKPRKLTPTDCAIRGCCGHEWWQQEWFTPCRAQLHQRC